MLFENLPKIEDENQKKAIDKLFNENINLVKMYKNQYKNIIQDELEREQFLFLNLYQSAIAYVQNDIFNKKGIYFIVTFKKRLLGNMCRLHQQNKDSKDLENILNENGDVDYMSYNTENEYSYNEYLFDERNKKYTYKEENDDFIF